jgi:mono/diheme cytochrome c family protein
VTRKTLLFALSMSSLTLAAPGTAPSSPVKRGEYLVNFGGCHDCHTPKKMGASSTPSGCWPGTRSRWR